MKDMKAAGLFLSTLPARGATGQQLAYPQAGPDFYPRSPRGERQDEASFTATALVFLSTLPARGATVSKLR